MPIRSSSPSILFLTALLFGLMASNANALSTSYGGVDDSTLKGTTGSLTINETTGDNTYEVVWTMDFEGYEGGVDNHQYLTHIAFKAFSDISYLKLDSILYVNVDSMTSSVSGLALYPANVNSSGCADGSMAGLVCVELDPRVDATNDGEIFAYFTVIGDLKLDEWSYRGKFGPKTGWVISESATPVPEPSAALVFALGLVTVSTRMRARR